MKVAVVTPYFKEPLEKLRRCHDSVMAQTRPCTHILVADGHPRDEIDAWRVEHYKLPQSHADYGNTPRALGSLSAFSRGYDAVAYLDADCWYDPRHVEAAIPLVQQGASVVISSRIIVLLTGEHSENEDRDILQQRAADTNCYFITATAAPLAAVWTTMPRSLAVVGDKVMFRALRHHRYRYGFTNEKTVFYESRWAKHFESMGKTPPPDTQRLDPLDVQRQYQRGIAISRLGFDPFPEW